ncbi:MAG: hypothetical protein Q9164_004857 [Protoblastenia rupestris]
MTHGKRIILVFVDVAIKTLGAKNAAALDKDLMSIGGFSLDQLMELAGLSVSQAGTKPQRII